LWLAGSAERALETQSATAMGTEGEQRLDAEERAGRSSTARTPVHARTGELSREPDRSDRRRAPWPDEEHAGELTRRAGRNRGSRRARGWGKIGARTGELGVRREDDHQRQRPPWLSRKTGRDAVENSMGWTRQRTHIRPGAMAGAGLELEGARGQQKAGARESSRARAGSRARAASWSRTPRRKRAIGKHQGIGAAWLGKAPGSCAARRARSRAEKKLHKQGDWHGREEERRVAGHAQRNVEQSGHQMNWSAGRLKKKTLYVDKDQGGQEIEDRTARVEGDKDRTPAARRFFPPRTRMRSAGEERLCAGRRNQASSELREMSAQQISQGVGVTGRKRNVRELHPGLERSQG
jgi:hypothetical protein